MFSNLRMYGRLLAELPAHARRRMGVDEARTIVRERMRTREQRFLEIMEQGVFAYPASPYRVLLDWAGISLARLRGLVEERKLEGALTSLRDAGVYVTFEEYKGRRPIVRGDRTLETDAAAFWSPLIQPTHSSQSGGSSGPSQRAPVSLEQSWETLPDMILQLEANGLLGLPQALCRGPLPQAGTTSVLSAMLMGWAPEVWFDTTVPGTSHPFRFWLADQAFRGAEWLSGTRPPRRRRLLPGEEMEVVRWAQDALRRRGACVIRSTVSLSLRISIAAREAGIDLKGAVFLNGAEPLTPAKRQGIALSGARSVPMYWTTDAGFLGASCPLAREEPVYHLQSDLVGVIERRREVPGAALPIDAMLFTSLRTHNGRILLNVELDDYADMAQATCGCPLSQAGFTTVLREIRSFGKQTGEGVTLVGTELVRIIDEVLPAQVGGTALDYQFTEEEDEGGFTRLILRISPRVQVDDEARVIALLDRTIEATGVPGQVASSIWRAAGTLRIVRDEPRWTEGFKLLPLDIRRPQRSESDQ